MGTLILYLGLLVSFLSIFFAPWIAAAAYLINSILQPQYIWPWIFEGIPIFKVTAAFAILAFGFSFFTKGLDLTIYKGKQNYLLILLWLIMHLSHTFTPFPGAPASTSPDIVLSTIDSIMIMYFVLLPTLNNEIGLKVLTSVIAASGLYYIFWANEAYFSGSWYMFSLGRLNGPAGSPYRDGNVLSVLIVMSLPFITLYAFLVKSRVLKWSILAAVPIGWHALFLFSSRGALIATVVTLVPIIILVKSKSFNLVLTLGFVIFLITQGGTLIDRSKVTVSNSTSEYSDAPINPRLVSWEIGLKMIPKNMILGAGVQKYEAASSFYYPNSTPHVAHNTFINFSVNTGIISGSIFLYLGIAVWMRWSSVRKLEESNLTTKLYLFYCSAIALLGFYFCSIFLDLIIFEPFYLLVLTNYLSYKQIISTDLNPTAISKVTE